MGYQSSLLWGIGAVSTLLLSTQILKGVSWACSSAMPPDLADASIAQLNSSSVADSASLSVEPVLLLSLTTPLSALSESELEQFSADFQTGIDSWLGLAGLNKKSSPPPLSSELQAYRQNWTAMNPGVAPFLGFWSDGEGYPYSVAIFPTTIENQVCVVEFRPEWSLMLWDEAEGDYTGKDVISEQVLSFSIAILQNGQLRSSQLQMAQLAISQAQDYLFGNTSEFMGVITKEDIIQTVAAVSPPLLATDIPADVQSPIAEAMLAHGCIVE